MATALFGDFPSEAPCTVEVIQRDLLRSDSRRYRRIRIPYSAIRIPQSAFSAPAPAELTYESARFFGENLFAERFGSVAQFSAFSIQAANETFNCFGATKPLRRFPQKTFQDSNIVIATDLVL